MKALRVFAAYFGLQAVVGIALWVVATASPTFRSWFDLVPDHPAVTNAFAIPDLAVIVIASALTARAVLLGSKGAVPLAALTAGSVLYPTVYLVGWVAMTGDQRSGAVALGMMIAPSLASCWAAYAIWRAG